MNDTITQYGFYKTQSLKNESYKPFQSKDNKDNKDNKGHDEDNHNGHGNGHTEHGHGHEHNNGVPIQDGFFILMIFIGFYLIYKYFKK